MGHVYNDSSTDLAIKRVSDCMFTSLKKNYSDVIEENSDLHVVSETKVSFLSRLHWSKKKETDIENIAEKLLNIHGLTRDHLDVVARFEDTFHAETNIADVSIDSNSNKSERTIRGILSEVMAGPNKLIGYRHLYRTMKQLYGTKKAQYLMGRLYDYSLAMNDSTAILIPYCFAMDASSLITTGRQFGQLWSAPAKRLSTYISVLNEVVHQFTNQIAGALAVGTFFMDSAWIMLNLERIGYETLRQNKVISVFDADAKTGEETEIKRDTVRKYVENCFQSFIHSMNSLSRQTYESPFTNVSIFSPEKMRGLISDESRSWYIDGLDIPHMPDATKEEKIEYMIKYIGEIQDIYMDLFDKGDPLKGGINYRFPVTTINISKEKGPDGKLRIAPGDDFFKKSIAKREIYRYNNMVSAGNKVASCCFVGNTMVPIKINDKPMEEMALVEAYDKWVSSGKVPGSFKVYQFGSWYEAHPVRVPARYKSIHKITLEDGTILPFCTNDHLHYMKGGVYKATSALKTSDELCIETSFKTRRSVSPVWKKIKSIDVIIASVTDATYVYCMEFENQKVQPVFALSCGLMTHNCRLITDVDEINAFGGMVNSFGGSATSYGSHRVVTINFPRVALESTSLEDYFDILDSRIEDAVYILHAHREMLKTTSSPKLHPFFANGWMSLNRLFSTVGVIGIAESVDILIAKIRSGEIRNTTGIDISRRKQIISNLTERALVQLNERVKMYSTKHPTFKNPFNIEEIPGEAMAVRLCDADKIIFGNDKVPYELYSNQFIPLWEEATIWERMAADGAYNKLFTGGGIVHFNLGEKVTPEQVEEMYDFSIESGCEHFALNPIYSMCVDNHTTFGDVDTCPQCGKQIEDKYTRVVGFFTPVSTWNKVRRSWEFPRRSFTKIHTKK